MIRRGAALIAAFALAGCEATTQQTSQPEPETAPQVAAVEPQPPARPEPPKIYMALQPDRSGAHSVVFALDVSRNDSPLDDPAVRLSPEDGNCNYQELRRYNFPIDRAARPVFGPEQEAQGIFAPDLPNFLATAVTAEMIRLGLVEDPDDSQPLNVCTRKLWEQLIINESVTN